MKILKHYCIDCNSMLVEEPNKMCEGCSDRKLQAILDTLDPPPKDWCWRGCSSILRHKHVKDLPYGNICPICNQSLRTHSLLGEGKEFDRKLFPRMTTRTRTYILSDPLNRMFHNDRLEELRSKKK